MATIRIATYNIRHAVGSGLTPEAADIAPVARVVSELDADVVCLQEVMSLHGRSGQENQAAFLAEACGYPCRATGENHRWENGGFGNVTLSRVPFLAQHNHDLTLGHRTPRGCLQTDLEWQGRMLHIFNLHLGLDWRERGRQLKRVKELARQTMSSNEDVAYTNAVTILAGDFNEWIPLRLCRWVQSVNELHGPRAKKGVEHRKLQGDCLRSFPTRFPLLSFDGVFSTSAPSLRIHRSEAARGASDHLPVIAEISI